ncbi:MAG: hypothetical protein JWQ97_2973 [Phenylobacterium sp.]|nr:hypothetical protein [Phenylobacterium sp.]
MLRASLAVVDLKDDLSRFHLLHYRRRVDGFLISGHNCGTHWLRHMLSAAIARHLDLPPPARSSGPESDAFIGNPRHPPRHAGAPRIGSSHHLPSRLVGVLARLGLVRLPPIVLLVRNIPDAVLSYFFKWRETKGLGALEDYLAKAPEAQGVDLWWYIRFFNRWGALSGAFPRTVLVVRYEDMEEAPAEWVRRIWAHWGVTLNEEALAAAAAASSRANLTARLDPAYGEDVAPDPRLRQRLRFRAAEAAILQRRLAVHLRHSFGYPRPVPIG